MKVKYILLLAYISLVTVGIFNAVAVFVNKQPADPTDLQYNERSLLQSNTQFPTCVYDTDCGNGKCYDDHGYSYCKCKGNYINFQGGICNYHQADKLELFLLSFFVGGLGVDWFMLAVPGSPQFAGYVVGGVFKLITAGGLGIWWLADWIRILVGTFLDSWGVQLGTANWQT